MGPISAKQTCTPASGIYCRSVEQKEKTNVFHFKQNFKRPKARNFDYLKILLSD